MKKTHATKNPVTSNDLKAQAFHVKLFQVDLSKIPVMSINRQIPRKYQAVLARDLFKQLDLKGISVTVPLHTGARAVNVTIPARQDYALNEKGFIADGCLVREANQNARLMFEVILKKAFPNHNDRSEAMSYSFDYKWVIYP